MLYAFLSLLFVGGSGVNPCFFCSDRCSLFSFLFWSLLLVRRSAVRCGPSSILCFGRCSSQRSSGVAVDPMFLFFWSLLLVIRSAVCS